MGSSGGYSRTASIPVLDQGPASGPVSGPARGTVAFQVGCVIAGKYEIERVLGEGGLGFVVAARHLELDQMVAIKYLRDEALASPSTVERFAREARLAANIKSDHVARVHDVGRTPDGAPYMVMEYLEGNDLRQRLEAGPIPIAEAVDYILQASEALAEAHTAGIVHRDLKPDNLFLAKRVAGSEIVKLLDFGISKLRPKGESDSRAHTQATDKFGTPSYMSPEQLRSSSDVDARADIWALGVILFEFLTKTTPFDGDSLAQLCTAILNDPVPALSPLCPDAPPELEEVILKCLSKDREGRFRNVAELAEELAAFALPKSLHRVDHIVGVVREAGGSIRPPRLSLSDAQPTPLSSTSDPVVRSSRRPIVLGAAGVLLLTGVAVFALRPGQRPTTPAAQANATAQAATPAIASPAASSMAPQPLAAQPDPSSSTPPAASVAKPAAPVQVRRPRPADKPPPSSKDTAFGERL